MSKGAELVQRALAALNAADIEALVALCDQDFELDMSDRVFNPATYRGHDGIRQFHTEVLEVWEQYVWEPEQVIEQETASSPLSAPPARAVEAAQKTTARQR